MIPQTNTHIQDKKISFKDITILVPVLNEEENVSLLVKIIEKLYPEISVFFIDDGSIDKTREIVKKINKRNPKIKLIDRTHKKIHGICASIIEGIQKTKTDYFIVMDGDLQHPPEAISDFKKEFEKGNLFVVASRKKIKNWKWQRKLISKIATILGKISLVLKRKKYPKDILSGFFGGKTSLFKELIKKNKKKFQLRGYKVLFDFLKITPKDVKISEFSYNFGERKKGSSKIKMKHIIFFLRGLI